MAKARNYNFNVWLKTTASYPFLELAKVWVPRKGRMTRDSVDVRAVAEYNFAPGIGRAAWDAFIIARGEHMVPGSCANTK